MRSALQIKPSHAAQETTVDGKWARMSVEIRVPTQKVVETVTANAVRNIPYSKNRMLIAPVISREVAKCSWLVKKLEQPRSAKTAEGRWARFVAKQVAGRDVVEAIRELPILPLDLGHLAELASFSIRELPVLPLDLGHLAELTSFSMPLDNAEGMHMKDISNPLEKLVEVDSQDLDVWSHLFAKSEAVAEEPSERTDTNSFFEPSNELVALWVAGMNEHIQEVGGDEIKVQQAQSSVELKRELARQLHKIINNFAKRKAYESGRYRITLGGNLYPSVEGLISDHLMLSPRRAVPFLNEFKRLLYAQSSQEPVFKGRWGMLIIDDANELVLDLMKRKNRRIQGLLKG